jgi:general secretion pathway protein D
MPILHLVRLRTTVVCPDRGTLLIGGMSGYFSLDAESSLPVWRHIPVLGRLGSNTYKGRERREYLILLRPRIIIPGEEEAVRFD